MSVEPDPATESFCYLTTVGRVTGRPHEIEIWFGLAGATLYMLASGRERSDWVKNLRRTPRVVVRIRARQFTGQAREVAPGMKTRSRARCCWRSTVPATVGT